MTQPSERQRAFREFMSGRGQLKTELRHLLHQMTTVRELLETEQQSEDFDEVTGVQSRRFARGVTERGSKRSR